MRHPLDTDDIVPVEPDQEDIEFLNKIDGGYIGITKPKVQRSYVPDHDPMYPWRKKEAKELNLNERDLGDEPDHMRTDEQGWS